ncbi:unnamed protein product [Caenorhabditis auriculariae]|uniref:DM10 domain-containing protein n=1 Tax=Caenorhabditis auriculariae TaxID=2777116 RepID=A0A8S1GWI3_9PELO|nr:unnamed protein product [Caenorhabditis auriculariae]
MMSISNDRRQRFYYKHGTMFIKDDQDHRTKPKITIPTIKLENSVLEPMNGLEEEVLSFDAYTEEKGMDENIRRIRKYRLEYHLADGSVAIEEMSPTDRKTPSQLINDKAVAHLRWSDFNVGNSVTIQEKSYRIVGCDQKTRDFFESKGVDIRQNEELPNSSWAVEKVLTASEPRSRQPNRRNLPPPAVLVFRCYWLDGSLEKLGALSRRIFKMFVYPVDDTVAMLEETVGYEGQIFLKRIKIPHPKEKSEERSFYRWWEYSPDAWIDVFCRPMHIFECEGKETLQYFDGKETCEQVVKLRCAMVNPPKSSHPPTFILLYDKAKKLADVYEEGNLPWSLHCNFLERVSTNGLSDSTFSPGNSVDLGGRRFHILQAATSD